jgi:hypothetical protein
MESLVSDALSLMTGAVGQIGRYMTEPLGSGAGLWSIAKTTGRGG